jgi:hypothetical protein
MSSFEAWCTPVWLGLSFGLTTEWSFAQGQTNRRPSGTEPPPTAFIVKGSRFISRSERRRTASRVPITLAVPLG